VKSAPPAPRPADYSGRLARWASTKAAGEGLAPLLHRRLRTRTLHLGHDDPGFAGVGFVAYRRKSNPAPLLAWSCKRSILFGHKGIISAKRIIDFSQRAEVVSWASHLGHDMGALVDAAFNFWFGGVAAYSLARLTWCFGAAILTYIERVYSLISGFGST
jgi:hypothetical protein